MKLIATFEAGDDVPSWLVTVTPSSPLSQLEYLRFMSRTEVYEHKDEYLILGEKLAGDVFMIAAKDVDLSAATKNIFYPTKVYKWSVTKEPGLPA